MKKIRKYRIRIMQNLFIRYNPIIRSDVRNSIANWSCLSFYATHPEMFPGLIGLTLTSL